MADGGKPLIVVTRPREESEAVGDRLVARGFAVLIEPMLNIVPLPASIPALDGFAALAFTSANGVRAFARSNGARDLPSYAVGPRTAAALGEAGFRDVRHGASDAAELARMIARDLGSSPQTPRVLHFSGKAVARDLAALLAPTGVGVQRVALYDAVPATTLSESLVSALYACTVQGVLFFSARTAEVFGTLLLGRSLTDMCRSIVASCLSPAVAAKAAGLPWARIDIAKIPTTDGLLNLLPPRDTDMAKR